MCVRTCVICRSVQGSGVVLVCLYLSVRMGLLRFPTRVSRGSYGEQSGAVVVMVVAVLWRACFGIFCREGG